MNVPTANLRPATFNDYEQITSLIKPYALENPKFEDWCNIWAENPVLSNGKNWHMGWVLESQEPGPDFKKIVGVYLNFPMQYELNNQRILVCVGYCLAVKEAYRAHSRPLISAHYELRGFDVFFNTTARVAAGKAIQRFGVVKIPYPKFDHSLFWITHYSGFIRSLIQHKKFPLPRVFLSVMVPFFYIFDFLIKNGFRLYFKKPAYPVHQRNAFNDDFDLFWKQLKSKNPNRFLAVRDSVNLKWHFNFLLKQNKAWIYSIDQNGSILAYAIFIQQDNTELNLKRMRLADFQTLSDDPEIFSSFLRTAKKICSKEKIHMIETFGFEMKKRSMIEKTKPYARQISAWPFFYKVLNLELEKKLSDPTVWDPSLYDGDGIL